MGQPTATWGRCCALRRGSAALIYGTGYHRERTGRPGGLALANRLRSAVCTAFALVEAVGMPGFEPGASTSRTWRAAKLRYIPFRGGGVPQAGRSARWGVGAAGLAAEEEAQVGLGLEGGEDEDLVGGARTGRRRRRPGPGRRGPRRPRWRRWGGPGSAGRRPRTGASSRVQLDQGDSAAPLGPEQATTSWTPTARSSSQVITAGADTAVSTPTRP